MKKILSLILILTLFASAFVMADNENRENSDDQRYGVNDNASEIEDVNNDSDIGESLRENANKTVRERIRNAKELREQMQERKEQLNEQIQELKEKRRELYQERNEIRVAVHALLLIRDIDTKVGPRIAEIAREFNNSEERLQRAEEKIQTRSRFIRFLFGANKQAVGDIEEITEIKQERIEELKQLRDEMKDDDTKQITTEQIEKIEQDQKRLKNLAREEKSKGIFSFLSK